jgi:hypothetical protein
MRCTGRRFLPTTPPAPAIAAPKPPKPAKARKPREAGGRRYNGQPSKKSRFLALVAERHGDLAGIPLDQVSPICRDLAPETGLDPGSARTALRAAVLAANGTSHDRQVPWLTAGGTP